MSEYKKTAPLDELFRVIGRSGRRPIYLLIAAQLLVLFAFVFGLAPSWPNTGVIALITFNTVLVGYLFLTIYLSRFQVDTLNKLRFFIPIVIILFSVTYIWLTANFTHRVGPFETIIGGDELTPVAAIFMKENPTVTLDQLLLAFGINPERVWERRSLMKMRVFIIAAWCALWLSITALLATFISRSKSMDSDSAQDQGKPKQDYGVPGQL